MIEVKNLSKRYGNNLAVKDVSFSIKEGEIVGFLGPNGAGKSTIMNFLTGYLSLTDGNVFVGGANVKDYDIETLRNNVAMGLQKNQLFSGTIKENLRWGNENATDEEIAYVCSLAQADEFIKTFPEGYDTYIEQGGSNVSGGQKQRLCIARALLKYP